MKKKRRNIVGKTALLAIIVAVTAFSAAYFFFPALFFKSSGERWSGGAAAEDITPGRVNILLMGFDRDASREGVYSIFRPDTLMIASLDLKNRDVSLISIPRDSYVKIANSEIYDKINHSYMYGYRREGAGDAHQSGIDTTIGTVEDFLGGVPIHYYVSVDMDGVREMVDRVGGVYFDVKYPVRSDFGRGYLMLDEGYQLLDGNKFLTYVRDRSVGGDFGRAARQQEIMIEAFSQIKKRGKIWDIPALYSSARHSMETNLNKAQIVQLALLGLRVKADTISTHVFTGSIQFAPQGGLDISYVVIDEQLRVQLIKEVFGADVPAREQITLPGPSYRPPEPLPSEWIEPEEREPEEDPESPEEDGSEPEGNGEEGETDPENGEGGEDEADNGSGSGSNGDNAVPEGEIMEE